jgi:Uma2 family endonuclease
MIAEPRVRLGMPMDEFIAQFEKAPFEYIDGEIKPLMPNLAIHVILAQILMELLLSFKKSASITVFSEATFVLTQDPDWVAGSRVPDLVIYDRERFEQYLAQHPDWQQRPIMLVPDLCIEIISKNDQFSDVMEKVRAYLHDGVRVVWVFDPPAQTVTVFAQGSQQFTILSADDTLDGGAVVRGFRVRVGDIFAAQV